MASDGGNTTETVIDLSFCEALQNYLLVRGINDKLYEYLESKCSELQVKFRHCSIHYPQKWIFVKFVEQVPSDESEEQPLELFSAYKGFTEVVHA